MNSSAIKFASCIALVVAVCPSLLYFFGVIDIELMKWVMLGGTIAWFALTPSWLGREQKTDNKNVAV